MKKFELEQTGQDGQTQMFKIIPCGIGEANENNNISTEYGVDTNTMFTSGYLEENINPKPVKVNGIAYKVMPWGQDNLLPNTMLDILSENMVTSQCQEFNTLCCYGQGVRFVDRKTKSDVDDEEILDFCLRNSLHEIFLEQSTDMKYWCWTVTVIVLSRDGNKIVQVRPRDAMYCRLEYALSTKSGNIEHVFYGDWRTTFYDEKKIEAIPLLDIWDPLSDLEIRMGKMPDPATGKSRQATKDRKFAIITKMATPGCQYYPTPYYASVFKDAWLDIYRLIGLGKRHMIKNTSAPRVQIEVHEDYWNSVCDNENILEPEKRVARKEKEKQNIIDFVTGVQNAGKALVSGYFIDPNGKENRMVRINQLNDAGKKEGGDWSDDMSEASNALCFAFGVHPNLVGATPGKSQMNNSGSDKRELFTLKQATQTPTHDVMCKPYHVILHYNGWHKKATVDVPMIQLTTLDKNTDSQKVSTNSNSNPEE